MNYIKGKVRQVIYENDSGFKVLLFKIKETDDQDLKDVINKAIKVTGVFGDINEENIYTLYGDYIEHYKYGYAFKTINYEKEEVKGKDAIIEFLSSPLIKGCGEKTATLIVDTLGEDALNLIKNDYQVLLRVPSISETKARRIYKSIVSYNEQDELIVELKRLGFSINEALLIIKNYGLEALKLVNDNIYKLINIIDFTRLDKIYLLNNKNDTEDRIIACIKESFNRSAYSDGNTYLDIEDILDYINSYFKIFISKDELLIYLDKLIDSGDVIFEDNKYYSKDYYNQEEDIVSNLRLINKQKKDKDNNIDNLINSIELEYDVKYNIDQKKAIKEALINNVSIITGGPGTGKTTIINSIVKIYIRINNLSPREVVDDIALLAPTGRASKKMAESTGMGASTIHRFLKWNKETNEFQVNEQNKNRHKLVIVDETSMIDTSLFDSLLKGLKSNIKLVLVGDANQLPSVGPGLILNDLIESNEFSHTNLERIYRQSANSYIPILAQEIKNKELDKDFTNQKDDYNFIEANALSIPDIISKVCIMSKEKGLNEEDIQVLAPMYRGSYGIDSLNKLLRDIYNPSDGRKSEIKYGDVIYREGDKVLQLVNDPDNNIFNGDIGYVHRIDSRNGKDIIIVNFDGNIVEYHKEDLINIKHAYCISIHKAQGSEFAHVIMPITTVYTKMLYNKLIYTGVSRAKKSLILVGEANALLLSINNDYSNNRKTSLKDRFIKYNL